MQPVLLPFAMGCSILPVDFAERRAASMTSLRTPILDDMVGGAHHQGEVLCCAFAPGPLWAASGGMDGQVVQWDLNTGMGGASWRADEKAIAACAISPNG